MKSNCLIVCVCLVTFALLAKGSPRSVQLKSKISLVDKFKYLPKRLKCLTSSSLESLLLKLTIPTEDVINENLMFQLFRISQTPTNSMESDSATVQDIMSRKLSAKAKEEDWRIAAKSLYVIHRLINSDIDSSHKNSVTPDTHFNYGNYPVSGSSSNKKMFSRRFIQHLDGIIYVVRMRISCLEQQLTTKKSTPEDIKKINYWRWTLSYAQYLTFLSQITDVSRAHVPKDSVSGSHNNKYSYLHDLMLLKGPLRVLQFFEGVFASAQAFTEATAQLLMAPTSFDAPICELPLPSTSKATPTTGDAATTGRLTKAAQTSSSFDFEVLISMYANELIDSDIERCVHQLASLQPRAMYARKYTVPARGATGGKDIDTTGVDARSNTAATAMAAVDIGSTSTYKLQMNMEQLSMNELQKLSQKIVGLFVSRQSILNEMKGTMLFDEDALLGNSEDESESVATSNSKSTRTRIPEWVHSLTRMKSVKY